MRKLILLIALLGWPTWALNPALAQEDALAPIASLLDAQTFAVARVDLAKIDAAAAVNFAATIIGEGVPAE